MGVGSAVCEEAELRGSISIGRQAVVHPNARVVAKGSSSVVLGDRTIVEDRVLIESDGNFETMTIGSDNLFESGCVIRSARVGNGNCFEPKAETSLGSVIGDNCLIGSGVVIAPNEHVPDNTIIVCVQNEHGKTRRIVRQQTDYSIKARESLTQRYLDTYLDAKSAYALAKNHHVLPSAQP